MTRSGIYKNNLKGKFSYKSFLPANLPPSPAIERTDAINALLLKAYIALGKLDGVSLFLPNQKLLISMYLRKEALLSSQIEGTQSTLDDIFDPFIDKNINSDIEEVLNYLKAIEEAKTLQETLPISNRFIKAVHKVLLDGIRGQDKEPGSYRHSQNWIGPYGANLSDATYIPPNVSDMNDCMDKLESFIHDDTYMDSIIKIGLIHYQFETIHPFLDGNGRVGRLLIHELLKSYNLITFDTLYISYYLKKHRMEYYDRLNAVRLNGDYEQWLMFFIKAITESANHAIDSIHKLLKLHDLNINSIQSIKGKEKHTVLRLFQYIEAHPIIDISQTSKAIGKSFNTVSNAIAKLVELNILKKAQGQKRNRLFAYEDYLEILRDGTF